MGQWNQERIAHVCVHCTRRHVEYSVSRVIRQKEPCCQCQDGPGGGQKARLEDLANDVVHRRVCLADTAAGLQKHARKENCAEREMRLRRISG